MDGRGFAIEVEHEEDGRWIAKVAELPGALVYGRTRERVQSNAIHVDTVAVTSGFDA